MRLRGLVMALMIWDVLRRGDGVLRLEGVSLAEEVEGVGGGVRCVGDGDACVLDGGGGLGDGGARRCGPVHGVAVHWGEL